MKHHRRTSWVARATLWLVVVVSACGTDGTQPERTPSVELGNPASLYCAEQGGSIDIVDEPNGQVGYCDLPDGTRVEEWEYYRSQTGGTVAPP